jgi:hypothetical protein
LIKESQLEHRVLTHLDCVKCKPGTPYLRQCGMGPGFGQIDLVLLPTTGRRKLVMVEAKRVSSADATSKVVGQLLMYYSAGLAIGSRGVRRLHRYCEEQPEVAKSTRMKSFQALAGGIDGSENAARLIRHGRRLQPAEIGLYLVMDKQPSPTLVMLTRSLRRHGLKIEILIAKSNSVSVCRSI